MGNFFYISVLAIAFVLASYFSYRSTRFIIQMLKKQQVMDIPNARSNHAMPVPRGGGLAIAGITLCGFLVATYWIGKLAGAWPLIVAAWLLGMVSFSDDVKGLPVKFRFGVQLIAVAIGLLLFPVKQSLGTDSLLWIIPTYALITFIWLWFINLYNFMDGIDGITGVETICIMLGATIIFAMQDFPAAYMALYATIVAGATFGFLFFNWHPASVFMGDVGSVVLGFIVGWMLIHMALIGQIVPAIILPLYYLMDAGITITKRLIAGENIFQAHSQHYYQQAVRNGMKHSKVSLSVLKLNLVLIALAVTSSLYPISGFACLLVALGSIYLTLRYFSK